MDKLKEYIDERFKDIGSLNSYWLLMDSEGLSIYCKIANSLYPMNESQSLLSYTGDESLENEEYQKLVERFIGLIHWQDTGSNSADRTLINFSLWALGDIHARKKGILTAQKLSRLEELKKEKAKIEVELNEILSPRQEEATKDE